MFYVEQASRIVVALAASVSPKRARAERSLFERVQSGVLRSTERVSVLSKTMRKIAKTGRLRGGYPQICPHFVRNFHLFCFGTF